MFKCDVCVLNRMWIKQKDFLFFLFAFGSDLYHPCFSKFLKLFSCEKHVFWVFSWPISCVSSTGSYMVQISIFSTLDKEFCDCFVSNSRVRLTWEKFRESASRENFQISFLKGFSCDICFKLLPSSPKPLV